jgi:antitoxin ChpS
VKLGGIVRAVARLIVQAHPRSRYTLAELMEQCELSAPATEESRAWLEADPVGREVL